ncbi:hypothetical protein [Aquiflexum lacus]|uniref:hypothetical protein n=1 Tax=Aquiflexum lacus TaxID=2483805 RepID=UPI001E35F582|nr:hypothetical protein [Aquiflexum lacus]
MIYNREGIVKIYIYIVMPINENHPVIRPQKKNITLWRYMDIPSLIYLLAKKSLFFVRADLLKINMKELYQRYQQKLLMIGQEKKFKKVFFAKDIGTYPNCLIRTNNLLKFLM